MGGMDMAQQKERNQKNAGTRNDAGFFMGAFREEVCGVVRIGI